MTDSAGARTVITAAGDSRSLFLSAGFHGPKSLVEWQGKPVVAHAIDSYALNRRLTTVAINANEDREWQVSNRIRQLFPDVSTVSIRSGVKGALASALVALQDQDECPLVVAAGDSAIEGGLSPFLSAFMERDLDAATIAFPSSNPRWSYISIDGVGGIQQVAEKQVIGPLATTGVFYFKSSKAFMAAASWCLVNSASHSGVFYVSTTLNFLVSAGARVGYEVIDRDQYRSWSLPVDFIWQSD